jgi:DNA-binding CsgD family transcriptional regulator
VLRRAAGGATNAEIAKSLGVGFESVKTLLRRAYIKLNARNRIEAIEEARRRGLV